MTKASDGPRLHLGVAYYPEQWPETRWEVDAGSWYEPGITTVRLGGVRLAHV